MAKNRNLSRIPNVLTGSQNNDATLSANISGNSATFTGTVIGATPTLATQLTTKAYVDSTNLLKANLASPTFTGFVQLPSANTLGNHTFGAGGSSVFDGTNGRLILDKLRIYLTGGQPQSQYHNIVSAATSNFDIVIPNRGGTMAMLESPNFTGTVTSPNYTLATASGDAYFRTNDVSSAKRRGLFLNDGASVAMQVYSGGSSTLGAFTEGVNTLVIGTGGSGGGGGAETILFHSTGRGNMFSINAASQLNTSHFPLTVNGSLSASSVFDTGSRVLSQRGQAYYQVDTWLQLNGNFGLYHPTSTGGTHFQPIINPSGAYFYSSWILQGFANGYNGLSFQGTTSGVATLHATIMYDAAANGGAYNGGNWHYYWAQSTRCLGLGGSATTSGYAAQTNGSHFVMENLVVSGAITSQNNYFYSNFGMYNPANNLYFGHPMGNQGWFLQSNTNIIQIEHRIGGGSIQGYIYGGGGSFGILSSSGNWAVQAFNGGGQLLGNWATIGTMTATSFANSSDMRLKVLVTDYDYKQLGNLNPITFKWMNGSDDLNHYGYAAQEVEKYMPQAVYYNDKGFMSVNYTEVLVAKVAFLEARVTELENKQ